MKQIKQIFLEGESPTLTMVLKWYDFLKGLFKMSFEVFRCIPGPIPLKLLPPVLLKAVPCPLSKKKNVMMNKLINEFNKLA